MNVIVTISDNGEAREAIPVRAIPWATDFHVSPDLLADDLSRSSCRMPGNSGHTPRLEDTTAYYLVGDGKARAMRPREWDAVVKALFWKGSPKHASRRKIGRNTLPSKKASPTRLLGEGAK